MASVMFKITENTFRDFTLAEVLLVAAMNQLETKRNAGGNERRLRNHFRVKVEVALLVQNLCSQSLTTSPLL